MDKDEAVAAEMGKLLAQAASAAGRVSNLLSDHADDMDPHSKALACMLIGAGYLKSLGVSREETATIAALYWLSAPQPRHGAV